MITKEMEQMADLLETNGIAAMDSVHLAVVSCAGADLFVTCDDKLVRKSRYISNLRCKVTRLLDIVTEVVK